MIGLLRSAHLRSQAEHLTSGEIYSFPSPRRTYSEYRSRFADKLKNFHARSANPQQKLNSAIFVSKLVSRIPIPPNARVAVIECQRSVLQTSQIGDCPA